MDLLWTCCGFVVQQAVNKSTTNRISGVWAKTTLKCIVCIATAIPQVTTYTITTTPCVKKARRDTLIDKKLHNDRLYADDTTKKTDVIHKQAVRLGGRHNMPPPHDFDFWPWSRCGSRMCQNAENWCICHPEIQIYTNIFKFQTGVLCYNKEI